MKQQEDDPEIEISDEEEYTDKRIKKRIMDARDSLNEVKKQLFTGRLLEPEVQISQAEAVIAWADLVRSYIRDLGVLLNHPDIPNADYYRNEVEIGSVSLIPPDKDGRQFSLIAYEGVSEDELKRNIAGFDRNATLPRPRRRDFRGLMSIVEQEPVISEQWLVVMNPTQVGPNQEQIVLEREQPVPREIYEKAIVESDQFLQQAGIGLDIEAKAYTGSNEPGV